MIWSGGFAAGILNLKRKPAEVYEMQLFMFEPEVDSCLYSASYSRSGTEYLKMFYGK
jgi:hypothetical protein